MDPITILVAFCILAGIGFIIGVNVFATKYIPYAKRKKVMEEENAIGLPNYNKVMVVNSGAFDIRIQEEALMVFINEFEKRFPIKRGLISKLFGLKDLKKAKDNLIIEWVDGDWFWSRDNDNKEYPEGHSFRVKIRGTTIAGNRIVVAARNHVEPPLSLGHTAFIHELTHWALNVTTGDPDRTHTNDDGPWTKEHNEMIEDLKSRF
jgi:hypothetical protein